MGYLPFHRLKRRHMPRTDSEFVSVTYVTLFFLSHLVSEHLEKYVRLVKHQNRISREEKLCNIPALMSLVLKLAVMANPFGCSLSLSLTTSLHSRKSCRWMRNLSVDWIIVSRRLCQACHILWWVLSCFATSILTIFKSNSPC